ncbi:hypothetical protein ABID26_006187 [Mesorhizobium shonense]|uniref:Uncharacterized protein n=1 Tax=Mesorhizobium shonense TaxID=1209948 RepID=A0ABV2I1N1_9HYPH
MDPRVKPEDDEESFAANPKPRNVVMGNAPTIAAAPPEPTP